MPGGWRYREHTHDSKGDGRRTALAFVGEDALHRFLQRSRRLIDRTRSVCKRSIGFFYERFQEARRRQPVDAAAAKRPAFYPEGLYVVLGVWLLTYLTVRLSQLVCDVIAFAVAIVISIFYVPGKRRMERFRRRGRGAAAANGTAATEGQERTGAAAAAAATTTATSARRSADTADAADEADTTERIKSRLESIASRETTEAESVEWVNSAIRKMWRLYNSELCATGKHILQDLIDATLRSNRPPFLQAVTVESLELHERAVRLPSIEKMPTRSDGDLVLLVGLRYDGDAKLLLNVRVGVSRGLSFLVPVIVSGLDMDAQLWVRARLIPEPPYLGIVNVALLRRPLIDLQLKPFKLVDVMEVPGLRSFLRRLLTVDIPSRFVLPNKIVVAKPATLAQLGQYARMGAWTGSRVDPCMGALTKARFLLKASAAKTGNGVDGGEEGVGGDWRSAADVGGEAFDDPSEDAGLLVVMLYGARNLSGTTSLGLSNPFCYISVDGSMVRSRPDKSTSAHSARGQPQWNQLFELPVRNPDSARLLVEVADRFGLKHRVIGVFSMPVSALRDGQRRDLWVPLRGSVGDEGRLHLGLQYQAYVDSDDDDLLGYAEEDAVQDRGGESNSPSRASTPVNETVSNRSPVRRDGDPGATARSDRVDGSARESVSVEVLEPDRLKRDL